MAIQSFEDLPLVRAAYLKSTTGGVAWKLDNLVGRLAEISEEKASGAVTFVTEIIAEAQKEKEPIAWIAGNGSIFYPPDIQGWGIDLSAIAVVSVEGENDSLTAAEWLVRSGSMGLVIVDVDPRWRVSDASLGRILKLAERAQCAVIFLTCKRCGEPSLSSMISLRGCVTRSGIRPFVIDIHTAKDKRSNSSSRQKKACHGPPGMY